MRSPLQPVKFCLTCVALFWAAHVASAADGKKYALCVGVEHYAHPKLREPLPLKYAVDDAAALGAVLSKSGFRVVLLTDETGAKDAKLLPTKANIVSQVESLARGCKEPDMLVLAFAGHGLQFSRDKDAYFCPQDARPFEDETATLVSVSKIYSELEKSFAGVKVILVDACRNDPTPGRGRGLDADNAPPPPKGVAALYSCSAGQRAFEHDDLKHGVFFHHVLLGLRGDAANKRGEVTFSGLAEYVADEVPGAVERLIPGQKQFPNMKADLVGRLPVLARIERVEPPKPPKPMPNKPGLVSGQKAGEEWDDNGLKMKFCWCPAGTFKMGSPASDKDAEDDEKPQVDVTLSRGFWLGKHEVTQGEWERVMGTTPWKGETYVKEGADYAASCVSWDDAVKFCETLSASERKAGRLSAAEEYRLPTEAEWEYACRSGKTTRYSFGDDANKLSEFAWWGGLVGEGNAKNEQYAHQVGQKKPNAWGLHDMHGNVWEWCSDGYGAKLVGGRDPTGAAEASARMIRGGSWDDSARSCRSALRYCNSPENRRIDLGFRLAAVQSSR